MRRESSGPAPSRRTNSSCRAWIRKNPPCRWASVLVSRFTTICAATSPCASLPVNGKPTVWPHEPDAASACAAGGLRSPRGVVNGRLATTPVGTSVTVTVPVAVCPSIPAVAAHAHLSGSGDERLLDDVERRAVHRRRARDGCRRVRWNRVGPGDAAARRHVPLRAGAAVEGEVLDAEHVRARPPRRVLERRGDVEHAPAERRVPGPGGRVVRAALEDLRDLEVLEQRRRRPDECRRAGDFRRREGRSRRVGVARASVAGERRVAGAVPVVRDRRERQQHAVAAAEVVARRDEREVCPLVREGGARPVEVRRADGEAVAEAAAGRLKVRGRIGDDVQPVVSGRADDEHAGGDRLLNGVLEQGRAGPSSSGADVDDADAERDELRRRDGDRLVAEDVVAERDDACRAAEAGHAETVVVVGRDDRCDRGPVADQVVAAVHAAGVVPARRDLVREVGDVGDAAVDDSDEDGRAARGEVERGVDVGGARTPIRTERRSWG